MTERTETELPKQTTTKRTTYVVLAVITMACGLATRADSIPLPQFLRLYAGDALWAMLVYWGYRLLAPSAQSKTHAATALVTTYLIELSQLYQAPWINAVRDTTLGALVLGFGFKWSDILLYTLGIALGTAIDHRMHQGRQPSPETPEHPEEQDI